MARQPVNAVRIFGVLSCVGEPFGLREVDRARSDDALILSTSKLGNLYLRQGSREKALQAYADASRCASFYPEQKQLIEAQIKRVSSDPIDKVRFAHFQSIRSEYLKSRVIGKSPPAVVQASYQ
jgi:hypothetical protein